MFQISESLAYGKWEKKRFQFLVDRFQSVLLYTKKYSEALWISRSIVTFSYNQYTKYFLVKLILCTKVHFGIGPLKIETAFNPTFCKPNFFANRFVSWFSKWFFFKSFNFLNFLRKNSWKVQYNLYFDIWAVPPQDFNASNEISFVKVREHLGWKTLSDMKKFS